MTDIHALLKTPTHVPAWQGTWTRVWLRPDVFSAQEYIVAAIAFDGGAVHDFRVLSGADRLACIYGDSAKTVFDQLLAELRAALSRARASHDKCAQLHLPGVFRIEPVGSLRTQMAGENLDRMLRDGTIPLEPDEPLGKKPRFLGRPSSEVVQEVLDKVKFRAGFAATQFLREDYFADQAHQVGVNLVTPRAAGIVASGWYAGAERIQLEFLLAAAKVESYAAATHKDDSALFFRRPTLSDGLSQVAWTEVEERLGVLEWQFEKKGVRVVTHDSADDLAVEVAQWASDFA